MGDAGYRLVLILFGLAVTRKWIKIDMFKNIGPLVSVLGVGTLVVGLVLGTAFGISLADAAWYPEALKKFMVVGDIAGLPAQMILAAMPATQGLYGFVAFLMWLLQGTEWMVENAAICFGVGVAVSLGCMISAIRHGQVCANGIVGISQGYDVQTNTMIYAAFPEFYAILALVGALMPVFLI